MYQRRKIRIWAFFCKMTTLIYAQIRSSFFVTKLLLTLGVFWDPLHSFKKYLNPCKRFLALKIKVKLLIIFAVYHCGFTKLTTFLVFTSTYILSFLTTMLFLLSFYLKQTKQKRTPTILDLSFQNSGSKFRITLLKWSFIPKLSLG